ncbi:XAF1 factor, partial [Alcedo cyanopectus]|nr:XAF1 factor [Ceyx cyanopectus]
FSLFPIYVFDSKRDVSAANFSLHEAHCLRFLALCPVCGEQVPQKNMKDHQTEAHKQVRCNLCHQSMQQYQLEHHETKECHKRAMKCKICELEMPFDQLEEHLNTCGSRTERCWDCNKFIMYKDQKKHKDTCQAAALSYLKDVNLQTTEASTDATLIYPTGKHNSSLSWAGSTLLNLTPPQASSFLDPSSRSEHAMAWKDVRPKTKEKDQRLSSKMVLKPSKEKIGFPSPARSELPTSPQALKDIESFDMLVTCANCNILLPFPTLQNHEVR